MLVILHILFFLMTGSILGSQGSCMTEHMTRQWVWFMMCYNMYVKEMATEHVASVFVPGQRKLPLQLSILNLLPQRYTNFHPTRLQSQLLVWWEELSMCFLTLWDKIDVSTPRPWSQLLTEKYVHRGGCHQTSTYYSPLQCKSLFPSFTISLLRENSAKLPRGVWCFSICRSKQSSCSEENSIYFQSLWAERQQQLQQFWVLALKLMQWKIKGTVFCTSECCHLGPQQEMHRTSTKEVTKYIYYEAGRNERAQTQFTPSGCWEPWDDTTSEGPLIRVRHAPIHSEVH